MYVVRWRLHIDDGAMGFAIAVRRREGGRQLEPI
jgi:hypothetical protein